MPEPAGAESGVLPSREALGVIESVSRAALADIQRGLGSLRSAGEADSASSPSLEELSQLIENARLADVQVELDRGTNPSTARGDPALAIGDRGIRGHGTAEWIAELAADSSDSSPIRAASKPPLSHR